MKVNFIVTGLFRSGGMRILFEYANRLQQKGHDVILYYPCFPYDFHKAKTGLIDNLKRIYWRFRELLFYKKIKKTLYPHSFTIKRIPLVNNFFLRNADASIATQWPTAYDVSKLDSSKGKKVYFIQDYEKWNSNIELVDGSYRLPLSRITISKYLEKFFINKFNVISDVVYNGINFNFFDNPAKKFNTQTKKILIIDHYLKKKGIEIGLAAIDKIKDHYKTRVEIICFGYEMYHNLPNYVKFYKNPDDDIIKKIYCESDILIFPSLEEGFGLPPAEAMACKCAVVSSFVGAIPEYAIHMKSALLTSPGNKDEIYNAVSFLLENNDELIRISNEGYDAVRKFFNWERSVNSFENLLYSSNENH